MNSTRVVAIGMIADARSLRAIRRRCQPTRANTLMLQMSLRDLPVRATKTGRREDYLATGVEEVGRRQMNYKTRRARAFLPTAPDPSFCGVERD